MRLDLVVLGIALVIIGVYIAVNVKKRYEKREGWDLSRPWVADPHIADKNCIGVSMTEYDGIWACEKDKDTIVNIINTSKTRENCMDKCIFEFPKCEARNLCLLMCGNPSRCNSAMTQAGLSGSRCDKVSQPPFGSTQPSEVLVWPIG